MRSIPKGQHFPSHFVQMYNHKSIRQEEKQAACDKESLGIEGCREHVQKVAQNVRGGEDGKSAESERLNEPLLKGHVFAVGTMLGQ